MFKKISNGCVKVVQRFLPDAFVFCLLLTLVVFVVAMPVTGMGPMKVLAAWGGGVWNLLTFSMQMALVLVLGSALASAPAVHRLLERLASIPKKPAGGVAFISMVSFITLFVNWGFGLIVSALFAREVAKKIDGLDYRLAVAAGYSGIVVSDVGMSSSIGLAMGSLGEDGAVANTGGIVTFPVGTLETVFAPWNLIMCLLAAVLCILVVWRMHPSPEDTVSIDPALLKESDGDELPEASSPAEHLERSMILTYIIVAIGAVYIIYYFIESGNILDSLTLNIVNLIFLIIGLALHKTPLGYVKAVGNAASGAAGIILQFPFYAGIQGMMVAVGPSGKSVASALSQFFVNISNWRTYPLCCYISAGIVNLFVPSGGGQWSVQGPIMLPGAQALGISPGVAAMGIAWGDSWTNLFQPFWALPALGIAGLGVRDIMGYCIILLAVAGIITIIGFLFIVPALTTLAVW